jgi:beta-galactosidase/beta-glucuronidase
MAKVLNHPNYGLSVSKDEKFAEDKLTYPLPRAVLRPNSYVLLDGEWRFALDMKDEGILDGWHLGHYYTETATWPGSVEEHMAKGQENTNSWKDKVIAWYERDFPLPEKENGDDSRNSMLELTFGACGYETRVWLNGIPLKTIEGEEVHIGEYTSFSYELNEEILKPVNRLTVRISDTMDADIPRGKQESHVYKRGGIWYHTYTGPVRSVWLETVERNRLRSRVGVVSIVEDNLVRFNIITRIHDPGSYVLKLKVFNKNDGEEPVAEDEYPLKLEAGQKQQRVVLEIPDAKHWSPNSPHLYRLVAQLIDEKSYTAEIETHLGYVKLKQEVVAFILITKRFILMVFYISPALLLTKK